MHNSPPDGVHFLIEFFGCVTEQLDDIAFWKRILTKAIEESDISILSEHFYQFTPHGITGYLLLASSHISYTHSLSSDTLPATSSVVARMMMANGIVKYIRAYVCHEKVRKRRLKRWGQVYLSFAV